MPQTTGKSPKAPAARTRKAAPAEQKRATDKTIDLVDRTADLSGDVLASLESGQRAAIAAVRRFVDTVDEALPALGDRPTRREAVIDAALDMADKLVTTQYDFLRSVVRSVDRSVKKQ
ncbi:MAG: hypothetical protein WCD35_09880, partial [Mycobacteriales bacterium]